ncbi:MAG: tRNA (guanosine(37)-N1)-methyltransferase TrmD [Chloroflexota bacterium]
MRIDILTLFPQMFDGPLAVSIIGRARDRGLIDVNLTDIRAFATDRHRTVDDTPYGGGPGMVMKPGPIFDAVNSVRSREAWIILLSAGGQRLDQEIVRTLSARDHLILICGHYEGVDDRVREHLADQEISIGDYVLTGGELPAMVMTDAVCRLLPGVLGDDASSADESHTSGLLEYPQFTRPELYRGWRVPEMLLSGHHARIAAWRRYQSLQRTEAVRPDLMRDNDHADLTELKRQFDEAPDL